MNAPTRTTDLSRPTSDDCESTPCSTSLDPHESTVDLPTHPVYTFRHAGWSRLRTAVWNALKETTTSGTRLHRFAHCGSNAWICHAEDDPSRLRIVADYCRDRFCRPCATAKARRLTNALEHFLGNKQLRFVTLTLRSSDAPLHSQINRLLKCFRRLRQRTLWNAHVKGGLAVLELSHSRDRNQWHPHLHILCEGSYLPSDQLRTAWTEVTGDSSIVDVRAVQGTGHAIRYLVKYIAKGVPGSILYNPVLAVEAMDALTGKRTCWCVGSWHGVKLKPIHVEEVWVSIGSLRDTLAAASRRVPEAMILLSRLVRHDRTKTKRSENAKEHEP